MTITHHGDLLRRLAIGFVCLNSVLMLNGCRRRQMPPLLPAVIMAPTAPPATPDVAPMESSVPDSISTASSVKVTQIKPKKNPRKVSPKGVTSDAPLTVDEAAAEPPSNGSSIGELSTGDDSNPKTQQEASDLIVESEQRLNTLSQTIVRMQMSQIRKVRYFLKQAKHALNTGDMEGAKTLATKAKLLMDDLENSH